MSLVTLSSSRRAFRADFAEQWTDRHGPVNCWAFYLIFRGKVFRLGYGGWRLLPEVTPGRIRQRCFEANLDSGCRAAGHTRTWLVHKSHIGASVAAEMERASK